MLSDKYLRAIAANREEITKTLLVSDVISDLRSCPSFTLEDAELVERKDTESAKASYLLDIISEKDNNCFEKFLDLLANTYEHLAEKIITTTQNKLRTRRLSMSEFGEILIKGGVPDMVSDYIPRKAIEDEILSKLKINNGKPVLVHGCVGCGKSSIVGHVLHSDELFPNRYTRVCWMVIGRIKEADVLSKLITLSTRIDSKSPDPSFQYPDMHKELINKKLRANNVLLILDDIWNREIMHYFSFSAPYVVTSRDSSLFANNQAESIEVPNGFFPDECSRFLNQEINQDLKRKIIQNSRGNPLYLSMIKNLLKSNKDYIRLSGDLNVNDLPISEVIKYSIEILNDEERKVFEMLAILNEDESVSNDVLHTYWDVTESLSLKYLNNFCDYHLMTKKWSEEYQCNMYGMHDFHWKYLVKYKAMEIKSFQGVFIKRHLNKFTDWLKINHSDPYFFMTCGKMLCSIGDYSKIVELFTNFMFLAAKIAIAGMSDLLFDYEIYRPSSNYELWDEFHAFFVRNNHRFVSQPGKHLEIKIKKVFVTIIQMALLEEKTTEVFNIAMSCTNKVSRNDFYVWENPEKSMKIWEASNIDTIELIEINHCGILLTSEAGRLSLYEFKNGKCLFSYKILEEKVILCKFLKHNSLEFILLTKKGKVRHFDILKLHDQRILPINRDFENDDDFIENVDTNATHEIDFQGLRQKFQRIDAIDFLKMCELETKDINEGKSVEYFAGCIDDGFISVASYSSARRAKLIAHYSLPDVALKSDFTIVNKNQQVQKIVHIKNEKKYLQFYILVDGIVYLYDDFGCEREKFEFEKETINDFIIVGNNIYLAFKNNVYKNKDSKPILTSSTTGFIERISMCHQSKLMALCLTDECIEIWNIKNNGKLLYNLKGFSFTAAYFEYCKNDLITVERSNISKWSLDFMNTDDSTDVQSPRLNYRPEFFMISTPESVMWILQRYNELEFRTYNNQEYDSFSIATSCEATCFAIEKEYALIGFVSSPLKVFKLSEISDLLTIESLNNVNQIASLGIASNQWKIIVLCNKDTIKIFSITISDPSYEELSSIQLTGLRTLKMTKMGCSYLLMALFNEPEFIIYSVNDNNKLLEFFKKSFSNEVNIMDFDVSNTEKFVCFARADGLLEIFETETGNLMCDYKLETQIVVRKCVFRPVEAGGWNVVAIAKDDAKIELIYFQNKRWDRTVNIIVEDSPQDVFEMSSTIKWSLDGMFLIFGDNDLRKWKIPLQPMISNVTNEYKYVLTKLYTHSGGIRCIHLNEGFICTIDQGGFFYIFRKI